MLALPSLVTLLSVLPTAIIAAPAQRSSNAGPSTGKAAQAFYVDGAHIPGVSNQTGDLGPSYAGLLPIGSSKHTSREL